jgi:hypothetical protein
MHIYTLIISSTKGMRRGGGNKKIQTNIVLVRYSKSMTTFSEYKKYLFYFIFYMYRVEKRGERYIGVYEKYKTSILLL